MSLKSDHILVIADTHIPFEHEDYIDFCVGISDKFSCGTIVHIGDLVDNHAISYHEHSPDGWSPADEMEEADKHLEEWFGVFTNVHLCRGNHDILVDRKGKTVGLPARCFKPFREIWKLPKGWVDAFEFQLDGTRFLHGTGYSGKYSHVQAAYDSRQSTVIGHTHSVAGIEWSANSKNVIFGMNVGSGIDCKKYAFAYGKDMRRKPVLGCGIVTDGGSYAQFIPMKT